MAQPFQPYDYESVAASQSAQVLGPGTATTKQGDYLKHLILVPATTSPGAVSIKDGADSAVTIFAGGSSSVTSLSSITIPILATSKTGSWQITTGADISVFAVGRFT